MDGVLELRYRAVFDAYGVGGRRLVLHVKSRLVEWRNSDSDYRRLRPDAELFLLINFDHMVIQPYIGGFLARPNSDEFMPRYQDLTHTQVWRKVDQALRVIRQRLPHSPHNEPVSSHEVLIAIDKSWDRLKTILLWA